MNAERFIHKNFVITTQEEEYLELMENLVIELLQSEQLCVSSEEEVLQAALRWLLHDPNNRKLSIFNILNQVRFPLISEAELEKSLEYCYDLSIKIAVKKFSQDMLNDRKLCKKLDLKLVKPHLVQPRKSARKCIYVIGGYFHTKGGRWSDIHTLETVDKYDTFSHEWETIPSLQYPRNHMGTSVANGQIYVVGGENESLIYDLVECYDPVSRKWSTSPPLTQPRCGHGLACLGDCLYAFGGWVGSELGDTVEKFDPATNEWTTLCKMPTLRFEMAVTELEGN
jgi:actin-binding protein IPP